MPSPKEKKVVKKTVAKRPTPKVRERTPKPTDDDAFRVTVEMIGTQYAGKGDTLIEAIASVEKPPHFRSRAVVTMTKGNRRTNVILHPLVLRKVLEKPIYRMLWAKIYANALSDHGK